MPDIDIYNDETVFVFGAGAANTYGFPLGPDLKNNILSLPDNSVKPFLDQHAGAIDLIPPFKEALHHGDYGTIDYFLERKKKYRELGAYYIVTVLASHESHESLFPQKELYADLFYLLDVESDSPDIPRVSVVTLNYDRSLEYFLAKNVEYNCCDELEEHALAKVKKLRIVHAHGTLGDLDSVKYGQAAKSPEAVAAAAKRIKIISDRLDESEDFREAQALIAGARNVVFLGFGYHPRTLSALIPEGSFDGKKIVGTAVRLPDDRKSELLIYFRSQIHLGGANQNCSSFMEHLGIGRENLKRQRIEQGGGHIQ